MPRVSDDHVRQRREQIISSARRLLEQRGLSHVSMAEIVAASGLSTGAVYSYFESKEALVLAVCMSAFTDVPGQIARHRTAREALAWLFDLISDPGYRRLGSQIWGEGPFQPELGQALARAHVVLADELAALIEADRVRSGASAQLTAQEVADVVIAAMDGYRERLAVETSLSRRRFQSALEGLLAQAGA